MTQFDELQPPEGLTPPPSPPESSPPARPIGPVWSWVNHLLGAGSDYERGNRLYEQKNYAGAVTFYDKAIQKKPTMHRALLKRGTALMNLHRYEEAIAGYDGAIQVNPDDYWGWTFRGRCLFHLADIRKPWPPWIKA